MSAVALRFRRPLFCAGRAAIPLSAAAESRRSMLLPLANQLSTNADERSVGANGKTAPMEPIRQVFLSQSTDVFANLALEDWLYQHHDFEHKHLLLLWRNEPCVVIGRHQNPWTESNVPYLRKSSVNLARRNSGGGTVYHDLGNINCTFFTRRPEYQRRRNLDIICSAIRRTTALDVSVNKREDIVLDNVHKISGTAAKLGKDNAYHHCTVLVDVNECVLHEALDSQAKEGIESRATQSVRVPVKNLRQVCPSLNAESLQEALGWEFLRTRSDGEDVGMDGARKQRGFTMIRPDEFWFPGLDKLRDELRSHQWIFGKTPKFEVSKTFALPASLSSSSANLQLEICLTVTHGTISEVHVRLPSGHFLDPDLVDLSALLHGLHFGPELPEVVGDILEQQDHANLDKDKADFLVECMWKMVEKIA